MIETGAMGRFLKLPGGIYFMELALLRNEIMKALKCTTLGGISQRRSLYGIRYGIYIYVDPCARAIYHESVRYAIGTCTTYMYAMHVLYTVGKLYYTVFLRRESDAALDATAAVQGKQSAAITSIHDGKHKYHSPK